MTPDSLSQMLSDFLEGARAAVVVEDGAIAFDLAESKYSISGEYNKCLLHLWSSERNFVRRVLDAEVKATTLRLQVQRMGQNRPTRLDFCRDRDQRSPAARRAARGAYEPRLRRALERNLPRLDRGPAHHQHRSRTLLRSGLPARLAAPGTARARRRRSERSGNAIDRRWRADLRNSLAAKPAGWRSRNAAWSKGWRWLCRRAWLR